MKILNEVPVEENDIGEQKQCHIECISEKINSSEFLEEVPYVILANLLILIEFLSPVNS